MENKLQMFQNEEFGKVRVLEIDGAPWFVGKDVTDILGYGKARNALAAHVDEDDALKRGLIDSMGRTQETTVINESGLYSLILSSKLPSAKAFKRWVTADILPSIRKHGAYITADTLREMMADSTFTTEMLQTLQAEVGKNAVLSAQIQEIKPKARYYDLILQTKNAIPVSIIAKDYGMTAPAFNRLLHDLKIQYRVGSTWLLYKDYSGRGYMATRTYFVNETTSSIHSYWTQAGRRFLYVILKLQGIVPIMEQESAAAMVH